VHRLRGDYGQALPSRDSRVRSLCVLQHCQSALHQCCRLGRYPTLEAPLMYMSLSAPYSTACKDAVAVTKKQHDALELCCSPGRN